eukprot:symbB.v1.2.006460.t1/scaffold325.1/size228936/5
MGPARSSGGLDMAPPSRAMLMRRAAFMLSCCWFSQMLLLFTWPSVSRRHLVLAAASTAATPSRSKAVEQTSDVQCIRDMAIKNALRDPESAPSFLRLAFHDAATKRSDAQGPPLNSKSAIPPTLLVWVLWLLLSSSSTWLWLWLLLPLNGSIRFELMRNENIGPSMRQALQFIEQIVQNCQVSWADAIAVSGAAVVEALGGPKIDVATGRKDALEEDAENRLPDGSLTSGAIRDYFRQLGFSDEELVALVGAHTIGRWTSLLGVQPACMAKEGLDFWICTREQGQRLPFTARPTLFNNDYFKNVLEFERRQKMPRPTKRYKDRPENGGLPALYLLPSDIGLLYDADLHKQVEKFAFDEAAFFAAFSRAYLKLVT